MSYTKLPPLDKNISRPLYEFLRKLGETQNEGTLQLAAISRGENPFGGGTPTAGVTDHGLLSGLSPDDDHDQYLLLRGRPAGQVAFGSIDTSTLSSIQDAGEFLTAKRKVDEVSWASIPLTNAAAQFDGIVLVLATHSNGSGMGGGVTNYHQTITDTKSNTWVKQAEYTTSFFAGVEEQTVSIWTCVVDTALVAGVDTLTANFSASIATKAIESRKFTLFSGASFTLVSSGTNGAADTDPEPQTISGLVDGEYLYVRALAIHGSGVDGAANSLFTPTGGFTPFTTDHTDSTNFTVESSFRNVASRGEFLASTLTSVTSNPDVDASIFPDVASIFAAFRVNTPVVGLLVLQSINRANAARIELNDSTIHVNADFINFRNIGSTTTLSYIRGSDGAFVGPIYPTLLSVEDSDFSIFGSADPTKIIKFEVDGLTAATTRTFSLPDVDGTIVVETGGGATTPQLDHDDLSNLTTGDPHTQYLLLAGRVGGQIIGNGVHAGANQTSDLAIEGQLLIDHADGNQSFAANRALDIRISPTSLSNTVVLNISVGWGSAISNGTFTGIDLVANGSMGAGGTSTIRGFRFINTGSVATGATLTETLGGLFQTTMSTLGGTINRATGLRIVCAGDTAATTITNGVTGLEVQIRPGGSSMTNARHLHITDLSGGTSGAITNYIGIDFLSAGGLNPVNAASVVNWSAIRIGAAPTNPSGTIRGLEIGDIKSHHVGAFRFGDTTTPTHRIELSAGTTTIAPIKFFSGSRLTTPEAGVMEHYQDGFYVTPSTTVARQQIATDLNVVCSDGDVVTADDELVLV